MPPKIGLSCALATPFAADGEIDLTRLTGHARWVLDEGCGSCTLFGTTGEGASLSLPDRERALAALTGAGFQGAELIMGVSACSVADAVEQMRLGIMAGCRATLLPPPFYFKDVPDEGLYAWFARVFERLGGQARDVILYHIPSVTAVGLSMGLISRLQAAFPEVILGVKDSSGDWRNAETLLGFRQELPDGGAGFQVLIGDERQLAQALEHGAAGTISGLANLVPGILRALVEDGRPDPRLGPMVEILLRHPVLPAIKALLAARTGEAAWAQPRPPLQPLDPGAAAGVQAVFADLLAQTSR